MRSLRKMSAVKYIMTVFTLALERKCTNVNYAGAMLNNLIETYQLCDLSTSQLASSPGFTYFSGAKHTTIDYIFGNQ